MHFSLEFHTAFVIMLFGWLWGFLEVGLLEETGLIRAFRLYHVVFYFDVISIKTAFF